MTTPTKIALCIWTSLGMMMTNLFSKPLHIREPFQAILAIGSFVPLGLAFYYLRKQKQEKQQSPVPVSAEMTAESRRSAKKGLLLMMAPGVLVALGAPLWLPVTGRSLGVQGDLICGVITAAIVCVIFAFPLRKLR